MRAGITPDEFIKDYYAKIKHLYPDITEKQVIDICKSLFKFVSSEMKSGSMKDIRIKYLGSFTIFPGRVKGMAKKVIELHEKGKVSSEYMAKIQMLAKKYQDNQKKNENNSLEEPDNG